MWAWISERSEVEASLKRLQTDWIDLYQVHRWDPWTDHEETLGALSDLVAQGKVRYIGSSTYPAAQIVKAQWVARAAMIPDRYDLSIPANQAKLEAADALAQLADGRACR